MTGQPKLGAVTFTGPNVLKKHAAKRVLFFFLHLKYDFIGHISSQSKVTLVHALGKETY